MSPRLAALFFAAAAALSQPVAAAAATAAAAAAPEEDAAAAAPRRLVPTVDVVVSLWFAAAAPCSVTPNSTRAVASLLKTVFGSESRKLHARCGHGGLTASSIVPVNATLLSAYAAKAGELQADLRDAWIEEALAESHHGALKGASVDAYPCVGPQMSRAVVDSQGRCQALVCAAGSYIEEEGDRWVCRATITTSEATLGALAVLSMLGVFVAVVASHFRSNAQRCPAAAGVAIDRSSEKDAAALPPVTVLVL
eukprot:Rhum_TRINITY_DN14345_c16_g1::Rhum_TRINITY_DN14345_c16_g1_i1::g.84878::m.84878